MFSPLNIIITLIVLGVVLFLQWILSKQRMKWMGLVLPAITFFGSIVIIMSQFFGENALLFEMNTSMILGLVFTFVLMNIPTFLLLIIFIVTGNKSNHRYGSGRGFR